MLLVVRRIFDDEHSCSSLSHPAFASFDDVVGILGRFRFFPTEAVVLVVAV
jgi:hypothetical protein